MAKKVKVYSTPTCPYCRQVKRFLETYNIEFENVDVSLDPAAGEEMMQKSGQMGVPVLDIDGQIIVGFDKEKITKSLGLS